MEDQIYDCFIALQILGVSSYCGVLLWFCYLNEPGLSASLIFLQCL